ncbi:MAG: DEAD/DEAH box helicase [Devosia sp.]|nr:DEAD/DEAH box helicase [Devosia sp.]
MDFLSGSSRAILADDTGLGKSAQAVRAADKIGAQRILVICQAIGRVSWAIEIPKWQTIPREVVQFTGNTKLIPPTPVAVVAAFDALSRAEARKQLRRLLRHAQMFGTFDAVVIDEAHHLGNADSNRTRAIYGAKLNLAGGVLLDVSGDRAPSTWLMSATIQRKNAGELYPHLRALFPDVLTKLFGGVIPAYDAFIARFCVTQDTPYGLEIVGNNPITIHELREALRPYVLRRAKKDVQQEIGPVQHLTLPLTLSPIPGAQRTSSELDALMAAISDDEDLPELSPSAAEERRLLGLAKTPAATEWIKDFLDANPDAKLGVFARHREVLDQLEAALAPYNPAVIHGSVSSAQRATRVDSFQNDPTCRVFIGQNTAAGTSITLTAAHYVLLLEPEGVAADNHQIVGRFDRLGQTESVTAFYGFAAGTADERYAARARRRAADFDDLIGALTTTAA